MTSFGLVLWASVHTMKSLLDISVKCAGPKQNNSLPHLPPDPPAWPGQLRKAEHPSPASFSPTAVPSVASLPISKQHPPAALLAESRPPACRRLLWTRPRGPPTWSLGQAASPEAPVGPPALARGSGLEPPRIHARLASTRGPGARPVRQPPLPPGRGLLLAAQSAAGPAPGSGWAGAHLDPLHAGLQLQLLHQALQGAHAGPGRHGG